MRTKALLCAAAIAAGAISAVAQNNVYSLNVVGYVNVSVPAGYSLLANPLSAGVTNGANEIMSLVDGSIYLTWNGSGFNYAQYDSTLGGWIDANFQPSVAPQLPPGKGFFYFNPGTATTVTFVGQVVPGPNTTNQLALPAGYSMVGSPLPASVTAITAAPVSVPQQDGMIILQWNGSGYKYSQFDSTLGGWIDANFQPTTQPGYNVGSGFFYFNPNTTINWNQSLP